MKACAGPTEDAPLLSPTQKLVYCEIVGLCSARAYCTYGAGSIGRRLAISRRTVERARLELRRVGLLDRKDRGSGREAMWFPTMPMFCRPNTRRLTEDELDHWADKLARHIIGKRGQPSLARDGDECETPILRAVP